MLKHLLVAVLAISAVSAYANITNNPYDPNVKSTCRDGSYSTSRGSGTCSNHGGVWR